MQCLSYYYYSKTFRHALTGPHIRNVVHIETLSLRKPAKLCVLVCVQILCGTTLVRKLAITPLTIKDSNDKDETCTSLWISFYFYFPQIIAISGNV